MVREPLVLRYSLASWSKSERHAGDQQAYEPDHRLGAQPPRVLEGSIQPTAQSSAKPPWPVHVQRSLSGFS